MNWYKKAQNVNVMGDIMSLIHSELIDEISYELFNGEIKAAIRVIDTDAGEVINLIRYPNHERALQIYNETIEKARY